MGSLTLMRIMRNMAVLSGALFFVLLTFPVSAQVRDTVIVTDTSRYVGQFPEGRGVLYSYGNGLYVGEFRNAVPEGKGMHFLPDGSIYAGELSDGKHCGFGRFFSDSGKIFSGEFDDDYANGLDTLWYPDGSVYVGKCVWGRPVSTLSPEYGRMYRGMHVPDYIVSAKPECRKVELTEEQQKFLDQYFADEVFPALTPQAIDPSHPLPVISALTLNFLVQLEDKHGVTRNIRVRA